ncbi:hypothetical protein AVEN_123866-1 [Araneus ventricosus]|uniref:Uncharacterized protein n=1 Tax=Araneus ventricosus TaxID=182803 RepID=A0A4Y2GCD5_ARAVE|nr:hypothetical protein AVEN_123866-1 [Araneus ventricosus]
MIRNHRRDIRKFTDTRTCGSKTKGIPIVIPAIANRASAAWASDVSRKKGRHGSSNTEVGVLITIIGHGPTPSEGTFRHRSEVTQSTPLLCPPMKRKPVYLSDNVPMVPSGHSSNEGYSGNDVYK